jgi:hypothetical protein
VPEFDSAVALGLGGVIHCALEAWKDDGLKANADQSLHGALSSSSSAEVSHDCW